MNKFSTIKNIVVALSVLIGLYTIFAYNFSATAYKSSAESYALLESKPVLAFGKSLSKDNNSYQLSLDEFGQAMIVFTSKEINARDFSLFNYQIAHLSHNYTVELIWVNDESPEPKSHVLLQANGASQSLLLANEPEWKGVIKQIGMRFSPQFHLGIKQPNKQPIEVLGATLSVADFPQNYFTLLNYWLDYKPLSYKTINHLSYNADVPIWLSARFFVLLWLLIMLLIHYTTAQNKKHGYALLISAWLMVDAFYLINSLKQDRWIQSLPKTLEEKIPDNRLYAIAQKLHAILKTSHQKESTKNTKVFVLTSQNYQRLRLIYHLLPANSGYLDYNRGFEDSHIQAGDYILSYDAQAQVLRPVDGLLRKNVLSLKVEEISSGADFSIMRVIK